MIGVSNYLLALTIISVHSSHGYLKNDIRYMSHTLGRQIYAVDESGLSQNQVQISDDQVSRSLIPKRKDTCKMFISGIIGTEPKEAYLNNNHYVINFALAVTGHYDSIHDWEKAKVCYLRVLKKSFYKIIEPLPFECKKRQAYRFLLHRIT